MAPSSVGPHPPIGLVGGFQGGRIPPWHSRVLVRPVVQRKRCQLQAGDPALGSCLQRGHIRCGQGQPHDLAQKERRLLGSEAHVAGAQLNELPARPQSYQQQRRIDARRDDQVQLRDIELRSKQGRLGVGTGRRANRLSHGVRRPGGRCLCCRVECDWRAHGCPRQSHEVSALRLGHLEQIRQPLSHRARGPARSAFKGADRVRGAACCLGQHLLGKVEFGPEPLQPALKTESLDR